MIRLSPAAERQVEELTDYYAQRGRDAAIDNLVASLERASARYLAGRGLFLDAPRPYPTMLRPGWQWTKQGGYWIAFSVATTGPVVRAVFWETANIPGRQSPANKRSGSGGKS